MDIVEQIMAFESGELTEDQTVAMFQELIDTGQVWQLQGSYGRQAMDFIDQGLCTLGPTGSEDAYGTYVPSRFEVKPGTKGAPDFKPTK